MCANKVRKGTMEGTTNRTSPFLKKFFLAFQERWEIRREVLLMNKQMSQAHGILLVPFDYKSAYLIVLCWWILFSIHEFSFISGKFTTFFILNSVWHLLSLMHLALEAAQCSQSSSFSHWATHLNNGGVKVPYSRTSVAMVVKDEESTLYLISDLEPPSEVGMWI